MNCLKRFDNFERRFFNHDSIFDFPCIDYFFRPHCLNHRFFSNRFFGNNLFDDSSDEEQELPKRIIRRQRRHNLKEKPSLNRQLFSKSFYSKTSLDQEGKPVTYSYQHQTENQFKNGHQYTQTTQTIKDGIEIILQEEVPGVKKVELAL